MELVTIEEKPEVSWQMTICKVVDSSGKLVRREVLASPAVMEMQSFNIVALGRLGLPLSHDIGSVYFTADILPARYRY